MLPSKIFPESKSRTNTSAWIALGAVCIIWGTTYLAIRVSLDAFPPCYLMAIRYSTSGGLMLLAAKLMGAKMPRGRELWLTSVLGVITIGMGTGLLCVAEEWIPTGLSALFIATQPFWMVLAQWALSAGSLRPHGATLRGLLVGIVGVAVLVAPQAVKEGWKGETFLGFLLLQLACAGWVVGALMQKKLDISAHPVVAGAVQQFATGIFFFVPAVLFEHTPHPTSWRPIVGMAYLITFGAMIGYSAFVYAMDRLPAPIVSVYTFVNPVVAVFLGWLFFRERFGIRELCAMLLIFAGIAVVKFSRAAGSLGPNERNPSVAVAD